MKSETDILNRLQKLKGRYLNHHLRQTQTRVYRNCAHNFVHRPRKLARPEEVEFDIAPRQTNSLVVIQPASSVHICIYGRQSSEWNGGICDKDNDAAPNCAWFTPKIPADTAESEFEKLLEDDKYVLEHYPDIAALQWVTGSRVHSVRIGLCDFFIYILSLFFLRYARKPPMLTEGVPDPGESPPSDLWED